MRHLSPAHRTLIKRAATDIAAVIPWSDTVQGYRYWAAVTTHLRQVYDASGKPEAASLPRDARITLYASPDLPDGYNTVLGYLAITADSRLSDDPKDTQRDGYWLATQCRRLDYEIVRVRACHAMAGKGVETVNAYPVHMLRERFHGGTNAGRSNAGPGSGRFRYTKRNPYAPRRTV